jgi:hypothetical protein
MAFTDETTSTRSPLRNTQCKNYHFVANQGLRTWLEPEPNSTTNTSNDSNNSYKKLHFETGIAKFGEVVVNM